ncbi:MAG: SDR family oxidoreductase [Acetobacteraceae bacterium]|nr:SDR family oxidoreductase [Acetobacteraceae bacterium]
MRSILVTGAASGIGAATARTFAAPGQALMLHTRKNREGVERVAATARQAGARAEIIMGDLADPATASHLVDATVQHFGALDVLVSNAGFADRTEFAILSDAGMMASVEAVQGAFFRLARAAIPHFNVRQGGRIIAISSFVAHVFRPGITLFPASAAAKAGLEALVRALAMELAPTGTTVNAVVPGLIQKDSGAHAAMTRAQFAEQIARIPLGRLGQPDDVAAVVKFLASTDASYVTGQAIHVSGGLVI